MRKNNRDSTAETAFANVTVEAVSATGGSIIGNVAGSVLASGAQTSFVVQLAIAAGETTTAEIDIVTDGGVFALTVSATGSAAAGLRVLADGTAVSANSPLIISPAVAGYTTSRASFDIQNLGGAPITISSVELAAGAADGLSIGSVGDVTIEAGGITSVSVTFSPTSSQDVTTSIVNILTDGSATPVSFLVETQTQSLTWASDAPSTAIVKEGSSITLGVVLPSADVKKFDFVVVNTVGTTASSDDYDIEIVRSETSNVADVVVTIADEMDAETSETVTIGLVTSSDTVTITIPTNDQPAATQSLDDGDNEVTVSVAGDMPGSVGGRGSVDVQISASNTVHQDGTPGSGSVNVKMVTSDSDEVASGLVADPEFEVDDEEGSTVSYKTAGASFTIDLDDGVVLSDNIQVTAPFRCGTPRSRVALLLYDTERGAGRSRWIRALRKCTVPVDPVVDEAGCEAIFTICHLTQFAVAEIVDTATDGADSPVSGAVDETGDGAGTETADEDDLKDGHIVVIAFACVAVLAVGAVVIRANMAKPAGEASDDMSSVNAMEAGNASSALSMANSGSTSLSGASSSTASSSDASSSASSDL